MMYKLTKPIFNNAKISCIIRINDNAIIPTDSSNTDYQTYLKWLEEGNQPLPADEPSEG